MMTPYRSATAKALTGTVTVPGDKSISHRALILGGLSVGRTDIAGLLESEDVLATAGAVAALGAHVDRLGPGKWQVDGVGVGGFGSPDQPLDMGNSGTAVRLLMGAVATTPLTAVFHGDASLSKRPMGRVMTPLASMGARFDAREGDRLPITVIGSDNPMPIQYRLPVASAQVKSAVLLAGLNAPGITTVIEPVLTRDHTENMLRHFGAQLELDTDEEGARRIRLTGQPELHAAPVVVPADPSSAAFFAVAAALVPGSRVKLLGVCLNPQRAGLFAVLREMGARLDLSNERDLAGEPVADITVQASTLSAVDVPPEVAPSMIDEYPILAVAAAAAEGTTILRGLGELRVKESDRLTAIADGLTANGIETQISGDDLTIVGTNGRVPGGGQVTTHLDHRIAMSFLVLGMISQQPVAVDDTDMIATSFPGFLTLMQTIGANFAAVDTPAEGAA